jgi:hypothetical protein
MKYNWIFNNQSFQCIKSLDGLTNVIETIHWQYEATDDTISGSVIGCTGFAAPTQEDFIPFENLTKDEIISWLEAVNDIDKLKSSAEHEYNQIKNSGNQELLPPPFQN